MKLNTLLLASAATVMATSVAFAADLPSKKAAPASGSVQVCKVGGMTGFTMPGSDTCVSIGGWVRFDAQYNMLDSVESNDGKLDWSSWGGKAHLNVDARSNTEIGVVRSFIGLEGTNSSFSVDKAYVQFAGVTAGRKTSLADTLGTQSDAMTLASNKKEGIDYQVKAGDLSLGVGLEAPNNNNEDGSSADNPDLVAQIAGSVGGVGFAVAAVSHQAGDLYSGDTTNGYAVKGNVNYTINGLRLGVFGGVARDASAYLGGTGTNGTGTGYVQYDYNGQEHTDSTLWGLSALYSQGKVSLGAEYAQYEVTNSWGTTGSSAETDHDTTEYAIFAGYQLAKGLTLYTEYHNIDISVKDGGAKVAAQSGENANSLLFRIQRDF